MIIPKPVSIDPRANDLEAQIASVGNRAGVYALAIEGRAPHIGWTAHLAKRLSRLLVSSYAGAGGFADRLRGRSSVIECWKTHSRLEGLLVMYELAKRHYRDDCLKKMHLRPPCFIGLADADGFPRLAVTNNISQKNGVWIGPFRSRDGAQRYEEEVLSLFQTRRCTERLEPSIDHPGCIYGEMHLCMRPCQCAVTISEYRSEVARLTEFLETNGASMIGGLTTARELAANNMAFEEAAQIHKRVERVQTVAALRDETVRETAKFKGVALTRGSSPRQVKLWPVVGGLWQEPLELEFAEEEVRTKSLDQELREQLTMRLEAAKQEGDRVEHLAIFCRWYYATRRDGEWFAFEDISGLRYRKLVRSISTLVNSPDPASC